MICSGCHQWCYGFNLFSRCNTGLLCGCWPHASGISCQHNGTEWCLLSRLMLHCRYASQVSAKLSCFWSLSTVGRPNIIGILNGLDMRDSLAAAGLTLGQVWGPWLFISNDSGC